MKQISRLKKKKGHLNRGNNSSFYHLREKKRRMNEEGGMEERNKEGGIRQTQNRNELKFQGHKEKKLQQMSY